MAVPWDAKTIYCSRHGAVEIIDEAEVVPGKWTPICALCLAEGGDNAR